MTNKQLMAKHFRLWVEAHIAGNETIEHKKAFIKFKNLFEGE